MPKSKIQSTFDRRQMICSVGGLLTSSLLSAPSWSAFASDYRPSTLGLVMYCCRHRQMSLLPAEDLFEPERFLRHCLRIGAGGMQVALGTRDPASLMTLRESLEQASMYLEAIVQVPRTPQDLERFEAEVKTAVSAGARAARTVIIPGRRYEYFDNLAEYREASARGREALERAAPIVAKYRLPLAVENHKDQLIDERVALFEHLSHEYIGACVDTGNSIALLEDPLETVSALAPWAMSVHLKDQAVSEYDHGFLLADIPLGQGCLDLKAIIRILRQAKPDVRLSLELITRDPLEVPCLQAKYWATFPVLPGERLARTLAMVRQRAAATLPQVSRLSTAEQVALEDLHVRQSLDFARDQLGLEKV